MLAAAAAAGLANVALYLIMAVQKKEVLKTCLDVAPLRRMLCQHPRDDSVQRLLLVSAEPRGVQMHRSALKEPGCCVYIQSKRPPGVRCARRDKNRVF